MQYRVEGNRSAGGSYYNESPSQGSSSRHGEREIETRWIETVGEEGNDNTQRLNGCKEWRKCMECRAVPGFLNLVNDVSFPQDWEHRMMSKNIFVGSQQIERIAQGDSKSVLLLQSILFCPWLPHCAPSSYSSPPHTPIYNGQPPKKKNKNYCIFPELLTYESLAFPFNFILFQQHNHKKRR